MRFSEEAFISLLCYYYLKYIKKYMLYNSDGGPTISHKESQDSLVDVFEEYIPNYDKEQV